MSPNKNEYFPYYLITTKFVFYLSSSIWKQPSTFVLSNLSPHGGLKWHVQHEFVCVCGSNWNDSVFFWRIAWRNDEDLLCFIGRTPIRINAHAVPKEFLRHIRLIWNTWEVSLRQHQANERLGRIYPIIDSWCTNGIFVMLFVLILTECGRFREFNANDCSRVRGAVNSLPSNYFPAQRPKSKW